MIKTYAYLLKVKFNKIRSRYFNNFISVSKCENIENVHMDNGRIISADTIEMTLTDIDFYLILDTYDYDSYEIEEAYFSKYKYMPKQFIEFVLEKYVKKTEYKGVER